MSRPPLAPRSRPSPPAPLIEFLPGVVYYTTLLHEPKPTDGVVFFSVDTKLVYNSFYLDFGPHNLGATFQFCTVMNKMVESARQGRRRIHFYSSPDPQMRANAVCLLGCWGVLFLGLRPEQAFGPFSGLSLPSFHDASPTTTLGFTLTVLDCLQGLARAVRLRYLDPTTFNIHEYHHYEQVENGDLTWVSPKFIAFAGPQGKYSLSPEGYVSLTPEHYIPYFRKKNVTLVVRLNEDAAYEAHRFTLNGIAHLNLVFPDGASPPPAMLQRFLDACEHTPGAVAVHCKAGLGRTGTCIAAYLMKHGHFTAKEAIGWLRLCRPGSVIGPQQEYLEDIQPEMWEQGQQQQEHHVSALSSKTTSANNGSATSSLFTTRAINIFGLRRSVELAPTTKEEPRPETSPSKKGPVNKNPQGDQLVRLKQQCQQRYVR